MAQQVNISQAQFKSLYFNENYSSIQIAEAMGISMGLLRQVASGLKMPLNQRPKGKRFVLNFIDDEQQETPQVESVAVEENEEEVFIRFKNDEEIEIVNDYSQNQETQNTQANYFQTVQD